MIFHILDFYRLSELGCPDLGYYWPYIKQTHQEKNLFCGLTCWTILALDAAYYQVSCYACSRLGTYFNLLVWIGALESCVTRE